MTVWIVTWFDGTGLRESIVTADIYNVVSAASSAGVYIYNIISIKRVPR